MDAADNRTSRALTIGDVADRLAVSAATVRRLVRAGELPAARVGRQWRVRPADVERMLAPVAAE